MREEPIQRMQTITSPTFCGGVQFHIINAQRRLADWHFEKAQTWEDLLAAHEKWLLDFNYQHHFAHEKREDGCHSVTRRIVLPAR